MIGTCFRQQRVMLSSSSRKLLPKRRSFQKLRETKASQVKMIREKVATAVNYTSNDANVKLNYPQIELRIKLHRAHVCKTEL